MYHIGQFRSNQTTDYYSDFENYTVEDYSRTMDGKTFHDVYINLDNIGVLSPNECYYLKFKIQRRKDSRQDIYLKLKKSNDDDVEQIVEKFSLNTSENETWSSFEIIFAPNDNYNQIIWQLERITQDYSQEYPNGRNIEIQVQQYSQLNDIIDTQLKNRFNNLNSLIKIGVQGPPSMLMCINKEQIRIGRSGIYEINNGMNITSISFVPKNTDYFIMDFEY